MMGERKQFRLHESILKRLATLPISSIRQREVAPTDRIMSRYTIDLVWPNEEGLRGGGYISLGFGRIANGRLIQGVNPHLIVSILEVNKVRLDDIDRTRFVRNPYECLTAILMAVTTINKLSLSTGNRIVHVVRANYNSLPMFERMRETGLYHYCDFSFNHLDKPETIGDLTLLSAEYPLGLLEHLGRFAVTGAVDLLTEMQNEINPGG